MSYGRQAAYLCSVTRLAADPGSGPWPRAVEFGLLAPGGVSPEHAVRLRNLSAVHGLVAGERAAGR